DAGTVNGRGARRGNRRRGPAGAPTVRPCAFRLAHAGTFAAHGTGSLAALRADRYSPARTRSEESVTQTPQPDTTGSATVRCNECGYEVRALDFCVRCGDPLAEEKRTASVVGRRSQFAAQPDERAFGVHVIS